MFRPIHPQGNGDYLDYMYVAPRERFNTTEVTILRVVVSLWQYSSRCRKYRHAIACCWTHVPTEEAVFSPHAPRVITARCMLYLPVGVRALVRSPALLALGWLFSSHAYLSRRASCIHAKREDRTPVGLRPTAYVSMVLLLSDTAV